MAVRLSSENPLWSNFEWHEWLVSRTSDRDMMNVAYDLWRDEIFVHDMKDSTRGKQYAVIRSNFRAWQKEEYGEAAMAKAFLQFPVANLEALVENLQNYISSPEYQKQRLKHLPKNQRNETACQPPVSSQTNGTAADQDAVANNDSIDAMASNDSNSTLGACVKTL